ncbi:multidrug ABC transporter ATP-binding protein [Paenibacillus baekrokdamisoli]|uniref:Multidrug ABC transporter ATP-binding protein n=1 Tax=Paenibacillus baekrokdamisoli TaxID=1712516 RepID=A0A3G9IVS4_9BACL|nr:ABC transporter ATP-binding protein [Paenibacillus baekrokdamisoli]MBB3068369.1 ABC-type multidrug transport system fused ATPase/permease subunit [Paenibacillus baekrokdamisoli]BBH22586.1 multidrug ABC transporter ATP-binding protein [Paenibacillus baekrokdamisoli]
MGLKQELKIILQLAKPYKWSLTNLFLCVVVTSFVGMLYPYIFGMLVDEAFYNHNKEIFVHIILVYVLIYLNEQSLHLILNAVWSYLMTRFLFDIRKKIFEKIFLIKTSWFQDSQTGNIITLINNDSEEFMNFLHWNFFYAIANSLRLLTAIVLITIMNYRLAILMFIIVPLSVYISMLFGRYIKRNLDLYRTEYGKTISWVLEIFNGLRDIHLLASERNVTRKFVVLLSKLIPLKNKNNFLELSSNRIITFISLCSDLILYTVSAFLIIKGKFTVGAFIATIEYFNQANSLLNSLSGANTRFQQNRVSIRRIFELWKEQEEEKHGEQLKVSKGVVKFNNISFGYEPEINILSELSLTLSTNESVALVGVSGSGKSTLINLLLRFYKPNHGSIQIDGIDINKYSVRSLRQNVGVVMQEPVLFDGTIKSNLQLAKRNATEEEILIALERANIKDLIDNLPDGLNTKVGEGGRQFSGGQIQRIAIARIFLKNPKILIFDEATSALDGDAEMIIQNALHELSHNRTTLTIAHRLSTIRQADRIIFLHAGSIKAVGNHENLIRECTEYAKIFNDNYVSKGGLNEEII